MRTFLTLLQNSLFLGVLLFELVYPSFGIHYLLLPCKKWMALGTDVHMDLVLCRTSYKRLSAGAGYFDLFIFGMNALLHSNLLEIFYAYCI